MAPPVAVYVAAAVLGVAAALAFKEFVYEPHIAPKLEAWAEDFLERRRAARSSRASAVPVRSSRRRHSSSSSNSSHHGNDPQRDRGESDGPKDFIVDGFELEALASREVDEWRNEVLRSQERTNGNLRMRRTNRFMDDFDGLNTTSTTLDESFTLLTHTPLASTHVISNVSSPITSGTASLPLTPTRRLRSVSQSTTTQGDVTTTEFPVSAHSTSHPAAESAVPLDITSPSPIAISNAHCQSAAIDGITQSLPFTPTNQVMADDSPFGPLLPDTPRSSAEMYGERPFSPITRVMGSSSGYVSLAGSQETLPSRANSVNSLRTFGGSGVLRKGSGLANQVVMGASDDGSDGEHHPHASTSTFTSANPSVGMNGSVISSLSERYPAPPTPPVLINISPPASSVGVISAPSSPRSAGSEVVVPHDVITSAPHSPSHALSQTRPSLPVLQLPPEESSPRLMSRSRSATTSPALSYASFLSPMPISRTASESEADEFLSVASDESDWGSRVVPSGPVHDRAHNPFLDFEHVQGESERGSEVGSDESWGSARRH